MLYTIGHSNKELSVLLDRLKQHDIQVLVDIRKRPYSRFSPQFNQKNVKANVEDLGMNYLFVGDILGGIEYEETDMDAFEEQINQLQILSTEKNVAIMCSEGTPYPTKHTPEGCHRWWKLSRYILKKNSLKNDSPSIFHILMDGAIAQASEADYLKYGIDFNGNKIPKKKPNKSDKNMNMKLL